MNEVFHGREDKVRREQRKIEVIMCIKDMYYLRHRPSLRVPRCECTLTGALDAGYLPCLLQGLPRRSNVTLVSGPLDCLEQ